MNKKRRHLLTAPKKVFLLASGSSSSYYIAKDGGSVYPIVISTLDITVSSNKTWLSVSFTNNGNNKLLTITATSNDSGTSTRTGTITVRNLDNNTITISITLYSSSWSFYTSDSSFNVSDASGYQYVTITSTKNGSWQGFSDYIHDSWITLSYYSSTSTTYTYRIDYTANPGETSRTGYIEFTQNTSGYSEKVYIYLSGPVYEFSITTGLSSYSVDYLQGSLTLTITSTRDGIGLSFTVTSNSNWLTCTTPNSFSTSNLITINYQENTTFESRIGSITLTLATSGNTIVISVTLLEGLYEFYSYNNYYYLIYSDALTISDRIYSQFNGRFASFTVDSSNVPDWCSLSIDSYDEYGAYLNISIDDNFTDLGRYAYIYLVLDDTDQYFLIEIYLRPEYWSFSITSADSSYNITDGVSYTKSITVQSYRNEYQYKQVSISSSDSSWLTASNISLNDGGLYVCKFDLNVSSNSTTTFRSGTLTLTLEDSGQTLTINVFLENSLDYVDLGLPSGTLWAKRKLLLNDLSNYYYGLYYYAQGNLTPSSNGGTFQSYVVKSYTSGDATYDAATAILGSPWRTPTYEDFEELISNCTITYEYSGHSSYTTDTDYWWYTVIFTGPNGSYIDFGNSGKPGYLYNVSGTATSPTKGYLYAPPFYAFFRISSKSNDSNTWCAVLHVSFNSNNFPVTVSDAKLYTSSYGPNLGSPEEYMMSILPVRNS